MNSNGIKFDTLWEYLCPIMKQIDDLTHETENLRLMVGQLQQKVNFLEKERAYSHPNFRNPAPDRVILPTSAFKSLMKDLRSAYRFSLPDDVLRIVFVNCLPHEREAVMKAHEAPLVFGRVCRTWRRIAWSTQELWDTLEIELPLLTHLPFRELDSRSDACIEAIRSWIKRSGGRPLYVSLKDKNPLDWPFHNPRTALLQRVFKEISTDSARWKGFRLELPGGIIRRFLQVESLELVALETLEIRNSSLTRVLPQVASRPAEMTTGDDHGFIGFHTIMAASSQRLRSLHIGDPTMAYPRNTLTLQNPPNFNQFPWDSLLDLSIGTEDPSNGCIALLNISQAHGILQHLAQSGTQLRSCRMVLSSSGSLAGRQISLPSLREITIMLSVGTPTFEDPLHHRDPADRHLLRFFSNLKCTSLRSFSYRADMESVFPFLPFLKEVQGLEKLHLYDIRVEENRETLEPWKECLRVCPHVTELHVSTMLSELYFEAIASFLQSLEILVLDCTAPLDRVQLFQTYVGNKSVSEPVLRIDMEKERYRRLLRRIWLVETLCNARIDSHGRVQLKEARLRASERLRDEALAHFAPLIARGLRVTFKEDYYDIPPPVDSPPSREGLWSSPDGIV